MPASSKIGSFRPLTFLHSGKPVRPYRPNTPNRTPSVRGIALSGNASYRDFTSNVKSINQSSPQQIGRSAVELQKSMGISINTTI